MLAVERPKEVQKSAQKPGNNKTLRPKLKIAILKIGVAPAVRT